MAEIRKKKIAATPTPEAPTPTATPEMQPQEQKKVDKRVIFNPDKSVTVEQGGETFNLNQEQYRQTLSPSGAFNKGGTISPQVQALKKISDTDEMRRKIDMQLKQGATIQQITQELLAKEAQKQQMPEFDLLTAEQTLEKEPEKKVQDNGDFFPTESIPSKIAGAFGINAPQRTFSGAVKGATEGAFSFVANVYDFVYSLTQGGKGIQQKEAEATFEKLDSDMNQDLSLIKIGLKNPNEVLKKLQLAEESINRLESSVKGFGKYNLRYWLTDGKDVEAMIIRNKDRINDYKIQLQAAIQEARLAEARINYGTNN